MKPLKIATKTTPTREIIMMIIEMIGMIVIEKAIVSGRAIPVGDATGSVKARGDGGVHGVNARRQMRMMMVVGIGKPGGRWWGERLGGQRVHRHRFSGRNRRQRSALKTMLNPQLVVH